MDRDPVESWHYIDDPEGLEEDPNVPESAWRDPGLGGDEPFGREGDWEPPETDEH